MVSLPSFLKFGSKSVNAKSAKRYTYDYGYKDNPKSNPDQLNVVSLKSYITSDPDLASAMRKFVDNTMIEMPRVIKSAGSKVADSTVDSYNEQLENVRFYRLMRNAMYSLLWNGNAYFEVKFSGKKLKEMYNIDPETIKIVTNAYGEPIGYKQQVSNAPEVNFTPEEIIHITIDHIETGEWGMAFLKPLQQSLKRKAVAEDYLQWMVENNKFAPLIKTKTIDSMTPVEMQRVRAEIEQTNIDANKLPFLNFGVDEDLELLHIFTTENFADVVAYIEKQKEAILTVLQVPPILAGSVDNSNRSNSEIQARYVFYNTITAFQNLVVEELDHEMLRKLKWKDVDFMFPEVDKRSETEIIQIAKALRTDLHFTEEAVLEYLRQAGFKIPAVAVIFDKTMDPAVMAENTNEAPSRMPRDKGGIPPNEKQRINDKKMGVTSNAN